MVVSLQDEGGGIEGVIADNPSTRKGSEEDGRAGHLARRRAFALSWREDALRAFARA
jgi:hypothetical protein